MADTDLQTYHGGRGKKATFEALDLDTLEDSRKSFARVIKAYGAGEISENMGRALTYMLSNYLNYWKLEKDLEIEERLDRIEEKIEGK